MRSNAQIRLKHPTLRMHLNVGNTPLVEIPSLGSSGVRIFAKQEWAQAGGSVKARAANRIIRSARRRGLLKPDIALLDASSGNTAIAYATMARGMQLPVVICLPENASAKRISTLRDLGAELIFTSPFEGTEGAQTEARRLHASAPARYYYADQYSNSANWKAHYHGTAPEILKQTDGEITHFVAGLGTTGTFTGTVRRLKERKPGVRAIALQPDSPMHGLEGWKHLATASVPRIYDDTLVDEMLEIDSEEAWEMIRFIADREGMLISPSAAANLVGAQRVARQIPSGVVVTVLPDSLERYDEVAEMIFGKPYDEITF
jgi:cysteine synthase B